MKKNLLVMIMVIVLVMAMLTGCGGNNKVEEVTKEGTTETKSDNNETTEEKEYFLVGMEAGYAPFNWTQLDDENGGVEIDGEREFAGGYDVEIAKKVAEGLGKELKVVKIAWDGLIPALQSGKIDAVMAGMSPTAERKEAIDFSDNYYTSDLVMVVKKGSSYENANSIQDFREAKITAQLGTFHYTVIDQIDGVVQETAMEDFPTMRVALEAGMIDGYVSERPEGVSASEANENFVMVEFDDGFEASEEDVAIAVGLIKGSELTEKINEILSNISVEERTEIMDNAIKNQPSAN